MKLQIKREKLATFIIWALPLILFFWILFQQLAPFGTFSVSCSATNCSPAIKGFAQKEQDKIIGKTQDGQLYQLITQDLTNIDVSTLQHFERAKVTMEFLPFDRDVSINIGTKGFHHNRPNRQVYIKSSLLDPVKNNWPSIREGDLVLYTKPNVHDTFSTISDFIINPPKREHVETFQYDMRSHDNLPNYQPTTSIHTINKFLRGSHTLLVYVGNEDLDMSFDVRELNRVAGKDDITFTVSNGALTYFSQKLPDDGITDSRAKPSDSKSVHILLKDLKPGIYTVSVSIPNDDGVITKIATKQSKFLFKDRIFLVDNDEYKNVGAHTLETSFYAVGSRITARTHHEKNLQSLLIENSTLELKDSINEFSKDISNRAPVLIKSPRNDVLLTSDYFFFAKENQFDPNFNKIDALSSNMPDTVWYVLSKEPPLEEDSRGWIISRAEFSGDEIYHSNNLYSFFIQSPELASRSSFMKLKKVTIQFYKSPVSLMQIWNSLYTKIKNIL